MKNNINFIGDYQIQKKEICNDMILFFEENKNLHKIGKFGNYETDIKKKDSTELTISPNQLDDRKYQIFKTNFRR